MGTISDYANPKCEECNGEGFCTYGQGEDVKDEPCQVCFPHGYENDEYDHPDD